jgi:hypothetical protein
MTVWLVSRAATTAKVRRCASQAVQRPKGHGRSESKPAVSSSPRRIRGIRSWCTGEVVGSSLVGRSQSSVSSATSRTSGRPVG